MAPAGEGLASSEYGFLGLGIMGTPMARNLLRAGLSVVVWNRNSAKCEELANEGASVASSPAEVVTRATVTFAMLADPAAALSVALGPSGVVEAIVPGKGYVDMSTIDASTSSQISKAIIEKGGRFLEAPVSGSKKPAEDGTLIILAAGDKSLFDDVAQAFKVFSKKAFFLGQVGMGANMKLVINMIMGSMMAAFSEGLAVAQKAGLAQQDLLDALDIGVLSNGLFKLKGPSVVQGKFPPAFPLKHQQKDMRLALALGDQLSQPMPVAAAANEIFKKARSLGLGDEDFAAVYKAVAQDFSS